MERREPPPAVGPDLSHKLAAYAAALRASPHNLLSPRGLEELESRHVPEGLALARLLPPGPARLVDVGSGGGLPGLVVALARPDLSVTLLEATAKKAVFLSRVADELGVEVSVVHGRAEEFGRGELRGAFRLATARAVAPLPRLIAWVLPLLAPGGRLYAVKGARWREELEAAGDALRNHRARVAATPDDAGAFDASVDPALRVVIIAAPPARGGRSR